MATFTDRTGQRFGRLTIKSFSHRKGKHLYWLCECDCGNEKTIEATSLLRGATKSCGCLHRELMISGDAARRGHNGRRGLEVAEDAIYHGYKKSAKYRDLEFSLDREYFVALAHQPCAYCGDMDGRKKRYTGDEFRMNGIDRVDNTKGYIKGNVVSCCKMCNRAKRDYEKSTFLSWIKRVYERSFA